MSLALANLRTGLAAALLSTAAPLFAADMHPAPTVMPADTTVFTRFYQAYADEWGRASAPVDPSAPPSRRPLPFPPQPETTPPYPFTEWVIDGLSPIGASLPNTADSPLMKAIGPGPIGQALEVAHIQIYGWVNAGGNLSTAKTGYGGNAPAAYMFTPNIIQLDQAVVYVERVPDTVQQDHVDWGFRVSGIYGANYRFSTGFGPFADPLVYHNYYAGFDLPMVLWRTLYPQCSRRVGAAFRTVHLSARYRSAARTQQLYVFALARLRDG